MTRVCPDCKLPFLLEESYKTDPALVSTVLAAEEMRGQVLPTVICFPCTKELKYIRVGCGECKEVTKIPVKLGDKYLGDSFKIAKEVDFKHKPRCKQV